MISQGVNQCRRVSFVRSRGLESSVYDKKELFEFTAGRWLFNEKSQRQARKTPFNVDAFCRAACAATGATAVTNISKISESFNRVLLVKFENGSEAIARFPTQIPGPPHYTTASEVATMEFLRRRIGIPVPRVIMWNSQASAHEVGAEFILMEKAPGTTLHAITQDSPLLPQEKGLLLRQLVELKKRILAVKFSGYGSIYFSRDIPEQQRLPYLLAPDVTASPLDSEFCLGPMARRDFWRGERASMKIDRGPWTTLQQYLFAVADREYQWTQEFSTPDLLDNTLSYLPQQSNVSELLRDLEYYKQMIPFLILDKESLLTSVLWRPDLHAHNILVEERERTKEGWRQFNIVSILDWQSAWAGPSILQLSVPHFFRWDHAITPIHDINLPDNLKDLSESEQKLARDEHKLSLVHRAFELGTFGRDIVCFRGREELLYLEGIMHDPWSYGLSFVRRGIINVCARWDCYSPEAALPFAIDDEYFEQHERAFGACAQLNAIRAPPCEEFGIEEFGYVEGSDPDHFLKVARAIEKRKEEFIAGGKNKEERRQREIVWPFQDTVDVGYNPRGILQDFIDL